MLGDATQVMGAKDLEAAEALSVERTRPPAVVAGYTAERFLGQGSFGEVWVARDENTGRQVAVKFFSHRGGLDWSLLSREVEKLRFLFNNRYVVQLLEVGWESKPPYYVMEYFEHGSLEQYLQDGPLPVDSAVRIFRSIAQALAHSHEKGVLHCDLKPANILLDADWQPRLADFGQARLLSEQTPALGTLFFMAPEQADLDAPPDARADVYALGAILYQMITGSVPRQTELLRDKLQQTQDLRERLEAYRAAVISSPAPSEHRKVRGVDRDLAAIIDRCLAADARRRFSNPEQVLEALKRRDASRARRPLLVLGGVGPILMILIVSLLAWNGFQTTVADASAALEARANRANRFAARFVAESVANQFNDRWEILEQAASDDELRRQLERAEADPENIEARESLQRRLVALSQATIKEGEAASWFLDDATGVQVARNPFDKETLYKNFAWRDYFHGMGHDLPPGVTDVRPIDKPHLSSTFVSRAVNRRMVAFTVPVWNVAAGSPGRRVIGVLALTVEVGRFGELQPDQDPLEDQAEASHRKQAVLVDTRADESGDAGLILQHPGLRSALAGSSGQTLPRLLYPPQIVERMVKLRQQRREHGRVSINDAMVDVFRDPVGGDYAGAWLIAMEPVFIGDRPKDVADSGLVVVVQDRRSDVTAPIGALRRRLVLRGILTLALVIVVIAGAWGFVFWIFNESSRSRFAVRLRRRAGLAPTNSGSSTRSADQGLASAQAVESVGLGAAFQTKREGGDA